VEGFPEFLCYNAAAIKEIMKPMFRVLALDDCDWVHFDHRFFYLKMQFYERIDALNTFAAHFNGSVHLIKVQCCIHAHPGIRPETVFLGNVEEQVLPCMHEPVPELNSDDRLDVMLNEVAASLYQIYHMKWNNKFR